MKRLLTLLGALFALLVPGVALAEGGMPAPGFEPSPTPDWTGVPESASVRPTNLDGNPNQAHARLVLATDSVQPGVPFELGVHLTHDEHWHTYWHSPGEVGKPTLIDWTLPAGATAGDLVFPVPDRYELTGIPMYGYDTDVLLITEITLPADTPVGTADVTADVQWLVCKTQCIDGAATLTLTVDVTDAAGAPTAQAPLFEYWGARRPSPILQAPFGIETALSTDAIHIDDEFQAVMVVTPIDPALVFAMESGAYPAFTPIYDPSWMLMDHHPVVEVLEDGRLKVVLEGYALGNEDGSLPTDARFGGLIQAKSGDTWIRSEAVAPIPFVAADVETVASTSPLFTGTGGPAVENPTEPVAPAQAPERSFLAMLGMAFLGGVILNIMPCVLPVITLKLYGLVEQAHITQQERNKAGLFYTLGIVASFAALAAVIIGVKLGGDSVGWGFQFQYPPYVIGLTTIVFLFGLSLFGVFEIPAFGSNTAYEAGAKEGAFGYFMTGAFATLLATPCSAPFLGTGMGFAFQLPAAGIMLFFVVAGLGLAFPFAVVAFIPALYRFMPQPGAWMETAKQFLGFTLVGTAVWLLTVVFGQTGMDGVTGFLIFLVFVSVAAWLYGRFWDQTEQAWGKGLIAVAMVLLTVGSGWKFLVFDVVQADDNCTTELASVDELVFDEEIPWQPFSDANVAALDGELRFVDFTADWCLTCKANEKTVLETETVRDAMAELNVVPLKADWTNKDEEITRWVERYERAGVPFYLVLPPNGGEPIMMGEFITPEMVVQNLEAGAGG